MPIKRDIVFLWDITCDCCGEPAQPPYVGPKEILPDGWVVIDTKVHCPQCDPS